MTKEGFSTRQLAAMRLPGAPESHQGWEKHAVTHGWEIRQHPGRGRGGMVREFIPPQQLAAIIERHCAGETIDEREVSEAMGKAPRKSITATKNALPKRRGSPQKTDDNHLGEARFLAWLMGRLLSRSKASESIQLDRHELALRILLAIGRQQGWRIESFLDRPEIVDQTIDLAISALPTQ